MGLYRNKDNKIMFGLIEGTANHYNVNPNVVRLALIAFFALIRQPAIGLAIYSILSIFAKTEGKSKEINFKNINTEKKEEGD